MPVPDLEATCAKFLEWVAPLLTEQELCDTRKLIEAFQREEGAKLQARLLTFASDKTLPNWLESFWLKSYLKYRKPIPVNSNVFYLLDEKPDSTNLSQTQKAALLITDLFELNTQIETGKLLPETEQGKPLCMTQYRYLFSTTRIPRLGNDQLKTDRSSSKAAFIAVFSHDQIFKVDICSAEGELKPCWEIERELQAIVDRSAIKSSQSDTLPLGVLTTLPRDEWANARDFLVGFSVQNEKVLTVIEEAMFTLSLDDAKPQTNLDKVRLLMHGTGRNRWFDKSFQVIVCADGTAGINTEHSRIDGSTTSVMLKFLAKKNEQRSAVTEWKRAVTIETPVPLKLESAPQITQQIRVAESKYADFIGNTAIRVLEFKAFGQQQIKSLKISPDAFVQIAFQIAQYKAFGRIESTYEAVMTRQFLHGRTETMRPVTTESTQFVKALVDGSDGCVDKPRLREYLSRSASKHISRILQCKAGEGIERHLFGLQKIYETCGSELGINSLPALFESRAFQALSYNRFSTSTATPVGMCLAGYGPAVEDGYAIRYIIKADQINFTLTSRTQQESNLELFTRQLEQALLDLSLLLKQGAGEFNL
ncbi:MAG: choline/carnitine O-acyltransferase [Amphritea sp.]